MVGSIRGPLHGAISSPPPDLREVVGALAPYLRIAHQIPGRIRFKVDAAITDDPLLGRLQDGSLNAALGAIRGVRDIRINRLARSCTVEYDVRLIPDRAWADLLAGSTSGDAHALLEILEDKYAELRHGES